MIVEKKNSISLRCPACGSVESHSMNIFEFSGSKRLSLSCSCGQKKAIVSTDNYRNFSLHYLCAICEEEHTVEFVADRFWEHVPHVLCCPDTGVKLGALGREEEEKEKENLEELINKMGYEDYFVNPVVMLDILDLIQDLAARGKVACLCGGRNIHIDLFPDRIKLVCADCGGELVLAAAREKDLEQITSKQEILLARRIDEYRR